MLLGDTQWTAPKAPVPAVVQQQQEAQQQAAQEAAAADPEVLAKSEEVELKVTASTADANDVLAHVSISPGPGT